MQSLYAEHARRLRSPITPPMPPIPGMPDGTAALDAAGMPIGSTGGLIPEQRSEADARLASLDAAAKEALATQKPAARADLPDGDARDRRYDAVGGMGPGRAAAPLVSPTQDTLNSANMPEPAMPAPAVARPGGTSSLAMGNLLGVNPALPGARGGRYRPSTTGSQPMDNLVALDDAANSLAAQRETRLLSQAGAGLNSTDTPEVQARKLAYLRSRALGDMAGEAQRAPGTPVYMGGAPEASDVTRDRARANAATARELAEQGRIAMVQQDQPRIITVGNDEKGQPIRRIYNPKTGNTEDPSEPVRPEALTDLGKLYRERQQAEASGNTAMVAKYDEAIANTKAGVQERPKVVNEFMADVMLFSKFQGDYGRYLAEYNKLVGAASKPAAATPKRELTAVEQQAKAWAEANPGDKRSAQILKKLGM